MQSAKNAKPLYKSSRGQTALSCPKSQRTGSAETNVPITDKKFSGGLGELFPKGPPDNNPDNNKEKQTKRSIEKWHNGKWDSSGLAAAAWVI